MPRITGEIDIARPVEVVFDYVADQRNEPKYNPTMLRSEKLTDGPIGVGTRFRASAISGRRHVDMHIEVIEYERPRMLRSTTVMAAADVEGTMTFQELDHGTRMRWSWSLTPKGVTRLLTPLIAVMGRREERRIWTGLKRHLESTSAPLA